MAPSSSGQTVECIAQALAQAQGRSLPWLDLSAFDLRLCPPDLVDAGLVEKHRVLPLRKRGERLTVAVSEAPTEEALQDIRFQSGLPIDTVIVAAGQLTAALRDFLAPFEAGGTAGESGPRCARPPALQWEADRATHSSEQQEHSLVAFLDRLLQDAVAAKASDIHFEPYEHCYRIRFRIDGVLCEVLRPPLKFASRIAVRLKVMAGMNIAERRLPQDGRLRVPRGPAQGIDCRINTLPGLWGEKLALRLLDNGSAELGIDFLGLEEAQKQSYLHALQRCQGLILVTGPTGSGKTASLYAGLRLLNQTERHIATAEDPVEMPVEGINQVAVNHKLGLGFPEILRAFLRQDPDVLMIGEIRDPETADIAIKAAQTGHLVLSTLHTNSALESLSRLRNMGVADYNLAGALTLIMAQRLIRRLCNYCKERRTLPETAMRAAGIDPGALPDGVFGAVGCPRCRSGYRGRVAIYEVVPISPALSRIIIEGQGQARLIEAIRREGSRELRQAALTKVAQGVTSLEEANRLT